MRGISKIWIARVGNKGRQAREIAPKPMWMVISAFRLNSSTAGSFGDDMHVPDMNTARRCGER